jgi:hypothetical protein
MTRHVHFAGPPVAVPIRNIPLVLYTTVWCAQKGTRRVQVKVTRQAVSAFWEGEKRPFYRGTWEAFIRLLVSSTE